MFRFEQGESMPVREERILKGWQERAIFRRSVEQRRGAPLFNFYDGPPFATGLPHYGHLLAGTIKDVVPRYKAMKGFCVPRRFGWDCHGLPVENEIEKAKELSGAASIEAFGIARFNEECRSIVLRYTGEWKKTVDRMGRWVDFDQTYRTMDLSFMESVWWVFRQLYDKGLVYEGFKVMPFSARLGTPLSNFEANLNYKEVDDPSIIVAFESTEEEGLYYLAWTTTPWTLPSNLALIAGPKIEYVKVRDPKSGKRYVVAEARLAWVFKEEMEVVERLKGQQLLRGCATSRSSRSLRSSQGHFAFSSTTLCRPTMGRGSSTPRPRSGRPTSSSASERGLSQCAQWTTTGNSRRRCLLMRALGSRTPTARSCRI